MAKYNYNKITKRLIQIIIDFEWIRVSNCSNDLCIIKIAIAHIYWLIIFSYSLSLVSIIHYHKKKLFKKYEWIF